MKKKYGNEGAHFRSPFRGLPLDILHPILAQLSDRKDWHSCTLVSKLFCRIASPFLYKTLDSRVISKDLIHHPSSTLLRRPDLALYVRHVTETGAIHKAMIPRYPNITKDTLAALALCKGLCSMTWTDDTSTTDETLLSFLNVLKTLPLRELTIRTHSDLGEPVWAQVVRLTGLRKVSIWCMEGPPRVLQGWSGKLGNTLTHLELGRCAGVPPTILVAVLSQLPLLKDLRLKGAPATSIPTILSFLPNLQSLDTDYLGSYRPRPYVVRVASSPSSRESDSDPEDPPFPVLRQLTVRTSSMDNMGPQSLWGWIRELVPFPGLETFRLHAFAFNMGHTEIPRMFILDLAQTHGKTLKNFVVGDASLTLSDVECLSSKFPLLKMLSCRIARQDMASITNAISSAKNLQTLKLNQEWIHHSATTLSNQFTLKDAKDMMLRSPDSKIRTIFIGYVQYTGKWIFEDGEAEESQRLKFTVLTSVAEDKWKT